MVPGGNVNQSHDVDAIDFAIIIGVVGTGGWVWQRYNNPEAMVLATIFALFLFVVRYSTWFWQLLAYIYENTTDDDVGCVSCNSLMADVIPGIARALPPERPVKSFTQRQPKLLPPPQDATQPVTAPHIKRESRDVTEEGNGQPIVLRKEVVTRPDGRVAELPRVVTPLPEQARFDFENITPDVTGVKILSSDLLLKALGAAPHVAIIGATGAGKSTLLRNLCYSAALRHERVMILDPHATPVSWPRSISVVGGGRNYDKIAEALEYVYLTMHKRYNELSSGAVAECTHEPIYIVCDEWRAIVQNIADAGKKLGAIITEARKVNIKIVLGGHSPYLKGLGLEDSAVRESLLLCFLRAKDEERWAEIDAARYRLVAPLPESAFASAVPVQPVVPPAETGFSEKSLPEEVVQPVLKNSKWPSDLPNDSLARLIRGLIDDGKSYNDICKMMGGSKATVLEKIHRAVGQHKQEIEE